jgi:hypothetical protein
MTGVRGHLIALSPKAQSGTSERPTTMRTFQSLSEQEILALAISLEEEDARIYDDFAEGLRLAFCTFLGDPMGNLV